jgi:C1A family cysteine protease
MQIGVTWYEAMFRPDSQGFLHLEGGEAGGHAVTLIGAHRDAKGPNGAIGRFTILNSWGRRWGKEDRAGNKNGRAYLTFDAFDILLKDQGEAAVVTEVKRN